MTLSPVTMMPLVDLAAQHGSLKAELDEAIARVFSSSHFILGPETAAFEAEFAAYCNAKAAITCGNGTDALELALWAVGVKPGDEVITVSHTFAATAEAIVRCGAIPRFVDVQPDTLLMDVNQIEAAINSKTVAIVPVHLYGNCVDMAAVTELAAGHGLKVVEDAAQAHGALTRGQRAGSVGDAGCFSFYPGKNLGACGDAGAVITSDSEIERRIRQARDHGRIGKYEHATVGRNSRMDALQAAILRVKLPYLDAWNRRRRALAVRYRTLLGSIEGIKVVASSESCEPVYHLLVVQADARDRIRTALASDGIATGIHYPIPLHLQRAFSDLGHSNEGESLPMTEAAANSVLSLPLFPEMTDAAVDMVVESVRASVQPR